MKKEGMYFVRPFVYQLVIGKSWGDGNVVSEHTDMHEAHRLADFYNKQTEHEDEVER
jgi:hypothetical protein